MKLSILICSIDSRKAFLDRLLAKLCPQTTDAVEVLVQCDQGQLTIGAKRNLLLTQSAGEYVCFVDDDDLVADNYVSQIVKAIDQSKPDCVGIEGIMTTNGVDPRKFVHSLKYRSWYEENGIYYRNPNHLNPIKWEIAAQEPFLSINSGEDSDFSKRVLKHLKSEVYIQGPIYFYEFRTNKKV